MKTVVISCLSECIVSDVVADDEEFLYSEEALDVVVEALRVLVTFVLILLVFLSAAVLSN